MRIGDLSYSFTCLAKNCPASRDFGAAKLRNEIEAVRHRRRFPHHEVVINETRVLYVLRETTPEVITTCPACRASIADCNANGCGGCAAPGWRDADDIPPF